MFPRGKLLTATLTVVLVLSFAEPSLTKNTDEHKGKRTRTLSSDVCAAWGQSHYRTFDGYLFSFKGHCTYLLARDCSDNSFAFHVNNAGPCESPSSCQVSVNIYVGKEEFILMDSPGGPVVIHQEKTHTVPTAVSGMLFQPVSDYVSITSWLGFRLKWNRRGTVLLQMGNQMKNKTCGLCGRFDGSVLNDFEMADGSIAYSVEAFVNSWTMNSSSEHCSKGAEVSYACNSVENTLEKAATGTCKKIWDARFSACHELVDPLPYYEACRMDYCSCSVPDESCICNSLEQYFRECVTLGGKVEGGWRTEDLCPRNCPAGMVYKDFSSSCPMTCKNTVYDCEDEHRVDGCHCPEGTVLHQNECLLSSQCPCFHNGREYSIGAQITQECNTCECLGGRWECTSQKCEARCSSVGLSHYTTFDGTKYEFLGLCPYYLVYHESFEIVHEKGLCPASAVVDEHSAEAEFCIHSIRVIYEGSVLVLKPNTKPVFDKTTVTRYPFEGNGLTIDFASSLFMKVGISNGVSMFWDGKNRIYIDAPPSMYGQTKGLCGTFNHNQNDDFTTPEGDVEADVNVFASRWKASDFCYRKLKIGVEIPPCSLQEQKLPEAVRLCSSLTRELFEECASEVDPDPFFKNCISDLCSCTRDLEKCLCDSFSDYAAACSRKGTIVNWTEKVPACVPLCENGQVYQECGNPCKRSCLTIAGSQNCLEKCVQGCTCPDGMTQNAAGLCIPIEQCPCIYEGKEYPANASRSQGTSTCKCQNAVWDCRSSRLNELIVSSTCNESNHEEFIPCMPVCQRRTCENFRLPNYCTSLGCKPGCTCKDGYVLDEDLNRCVRVKECGCRHGQHKYAEGSSIWKDCNSCTCKNGGWDCTKTACPGICTVWGESHFKTFDGRIFEFQGDCEYILFQGKLGDTEISLTVLNVPCGTGGITCSKSFTLNLGNDKIVLSRDNPVSFLGFHGPHIYAYEVGLFVSVYTDFGISLRWDKGTRMYVNVDARWRGNVGGLCGNYNDDQSDDFLSPIGGLPEARPTLFADSWKIQESCPAARTTDDACSLHPNREAWARQKCAIIKSDLFAPCHSEVSVGPFFERCVFDSCACDTGGDWECLCTAIAAYAQECNVKGVHISWRTQELCPIQCEECATYESCMSPCALKTCETQYEYKYISYCVTESCVEGCKPKPCPPGQIFNNARDLQCIPEVECVVPCKEINGRMYNEGERVTDPEVADPCQSCFCLQGDVICNGPPCPTTPPPTTVTLAQGECQETRWTSWMNTPRTNGGDYENVHNFALFQIYSKYCLLNHITDIECRVARSKIPYDESGQNVVCELPDGLICKDEKNLELCEDYEIRLFCNCGSSTVPTAITTTSRTTNSSTMGSSTVPTAITTTSRTTNSSTMGTPNLSPETTTQHSNTFPTTSRRTVTSETDTTESTTLSTKGLCPPGEIYDICAYHCEQTCSSFMQDPYLIEKCSEENCVEGCRRPTHKCTSPYVWRDFSTCVPREECPCLIANDTIIAPYEVVERGCEICQCVNEHVNCFTSPRCYTTRKPGSRTIPETSTSIAVSPRTPLSVPCISGWTEWFNKHVPNEYEEYETLQSIRAAGGYFCINDWITAVECRKVEGPNHHLLQDGVICDLKHGLMCNSSNLILGRKCDDYEIRFYCNCPPSLTPITETASPTPTNTSTTPIPVVPCPETPITLLEQCRPCPEGYSCNGRSCVRFVDCPCFQEGRYFNAGERIITSTCNICGCVLGGNSECKPVTCQNCLEGQKPELTEDCKCICTGCPVGTVFCPSYGQCLELKLLCNGNIDCPDVVVDCSETTGTPAVTPETTSTQPNITFSTRSTPSLTPETTPTQSTTTTFPTPNKNCTNTTLIPSCRPGEALKISEEEGCLIYKCECDAKFCPPVVCPTFVEEGEEYAVVKEGCCLQCKSQCYPKKCKGPVTCPPGFRLSTFNGKCCTLSTCERTPLTPEITTQSTTTFPTTTATPAVTPETTSTQPNITFSTRSTPSLTPETTPKQSTTTTFPTPNKTCTNTPLIPSCRPGEALKISEEEGCLIYKCECDAKFCPPVVCPTFVEEGEEYAVVKEGCCLQCKSQCYPKKCKGPVTCPPGFRLSTFNGKCCTLSTCERTPLTPEITTQSTTTFPTTNKNCTNTPLIPSCRPGEVLKISDEEGCLVYKCGCDAKFCPPVVCPIFVEEGEEYAVVKEGCCLQCKSQCYPEKCKGPVSCPPGFKLSTFNGKCCTLSTCVPKQKKCVFRHEHEVVNSTDFPLHPEQYYYKEYEVGSSWMDGFCRRCACIESDGWLSYTCSVEACPDVTRLPDVDSYKWEIKHIPGVCCPQPRRDKCVHEGKVYSPGDKWPSSNGDSCKYYQCVKTNGEVYIRKITFTCDENCPVNTEYVRPEPNSQRCCGYCRSAICEENGTIHQINSVWKSAIWLCYNAKCVASEKNTPKIVYKKRKCPAIPGNCPRENVVLDSNGCCETCKKPQPPKVCKPQGVPEEETVEHFVIHDTSHGLCSNRQKLEGLTRCFGQCEQEMKYNSWNSFQNMCTCCLPKSSELREITLDCDDGAQIKKNYEQPIDCYCTSCGGSNQPGVGFPPTS